LRSKFDEWKSIWRREGGREGGRGGRDYEQEGRQRVRDEKR
jgi:hypothetical protein